MNGCAMKLKRNLPERSRNLYRELKQAGRVDQYGREKGEQAAEHKEGFIGVGMDEGLLRIWPANL